MSTSRIKGIFLRYFYAMRKGPYQLTDLFYWPLVDILLWGLTSLWLQQQQISSNIPQILMTALIFWQIAWRGSVDISTSLLQEFWNRNLVNLFGTPLKISEWICGVLLLGLCKLAITITFGSVMVYLLYALNVFAIGWLFLPFSLLLVMFGWTIGFCAAALIIYWGKHAEMVAWMATGIFSPFSAVFYPVDVLPLWAQHISWSLPTSYIFEGMRHILITGTFPYSYAVISLLLTLLYLVLSILLFYTMFEKGRNKGLTHLE